MDSNEAMFRVIFIGVIVYILNSAISQPNSGIVNTKYGQIRGEQLSFEGTKYTAFKGIPYAKPPLGDLRFKDPEPPENWTGVKDGTKFGSVCLQGDKIEKSSEDCLTLNVFTPSYGGNSLKPVLFWIHGGAFVSLDGTDDFFGTEYFMQQDIVAVTINYRLGPLGFLSTNTSDASGNWGLKDQVAALKWVQENIEEFGGDPKKVTIYGESAGGISVHLQMLSPLSKGLFRSAIASSGSGSLSIMRTGHQQERFSRNMAKLLGASESEIEDPASRIQFLRSADAKEIIKRTLAVLDEEDLVDPFTAPMPFYPVIENNDVEGAFITENPEKLLAEGNFSKIPLMMGVNSLEGGAAHNSKDGKNMSAEARREMEKDVCLFLPIYLKEAISARNECSLVTQQIRDAYFDGGSFADSLLNFLYLWGDVIFVRDVNYGQQMHAKHGDKKDSPVFRYYFDYSGRWNFFKTMHNITFPGAMHGEDFLYVFKPKMIPLPALPASAPEVKTKDRMISFITNFVKHGHPTPLISDLIPVEWKPALKDTPFTMFISDELKLENEFLRRRMEMWDNIRAKYIDGTSRASYGGQPPLSMLSFIWLVAIVYLFHS